MNIELNLHNNRGYAWVEKDGIHMKGYLLGESNEAFFSRLSSATTPEALRTELLQTCGFFALVIVRGDEVFACADPLRSIPLFYEADGETIRIYDHLQTQAMQTHEIDEDAWQQFSHSPYVNGEKTLLSGISQIQAGHYLYCSNCTAPSQEHYWSYTYASEQIQDQNTAVDLISQTYGTVFEQVVQCIGDRTAVIPLSGGHDSRLIAYYLKKYGCKHVVTYTYGQEGNTDSKISKQVAQRLGFDHYFIPYDTVSQQRYKAIYQEYFLYAGNCVSVPLIQELCALDYLQRQGVLDKNCVAVPGFGGILTGHYVHESYLDKSSRKGGEFLQFILSNYFSSTPIRKAEEKREMIKTLEGQLGIQENDLINAVHGNEIFETYTFREEQAKFIMNALRVYEFFGLSWITPLVDQRLFAVWSKIDNTLRFGDNAFKAMEQKEFQDIFSGIPFTGSKEMKHFHKNSAPSKKEIWLARFQRYFQPYKTHMLVRQIGLWDYYRCLLGSHENGINYCVKKRYSDMIKRSTHN